MTKDEALRMALEALEEAWYHVGTFQPTEKAIDLYDEARTAIKEALAQPEQEPKCNQHPKAPHGFNRNASHANDRYTCECEEWDAYDAGYQAGVLAGIEASMGQEPEQEPVAMKFKIYKPTVPDPTRQGINNALLPWVYDQDRSSGFDASMWVTPVATLPPQRKPLTWEQIKQCQEKASSKWCGVEELFVLYARAIEAAHGIKGDA